MTEDWVKIASFSANDRFRSSGALREARCNPKDFLQIRSIYFSPYPGMLDFVLTHAIDYQAFIKVDSDSLEDMLLIFAKFDTIRAVEYRMLF